MKKEQLFDLDSVLAEIESLIDPANLMLWDLTQDFFTHDVSQDVYILCEYGRAATRANIAEDYMARIKEKVSELRNITNTMSREMRQHEG